MADQDRKQNQGDMDDKKQGGQQGGPGGQHGGQQGGQGGQQGGQSGQGQKKPEGGQDPNRR